MNTAMVWIDSHSHLSQTFLHRGEQAFVQDFETARQAGVQEFLLGGIDPRDWALQLDLQKRFPGILPGLGLHPYFVAEQGFPECEAALDELAKLADRAFAIGETGLDFRSQYIPNELARERQLECFQNQIDLAIFLQKPLILHVVRAFDEAHRMIQFSKARRGLVHGFNGSLKQAEAWMQMGFALSIGAQVLKPENERLFQAVQGCDPDFLLVESDDLAPITILQVAERVAALKSQSEGRLVTRGDILAKSRDNLLRILGRGITATR